MKTRIELYEKAIQELNEARMKRVKETISNMVIDVVLISGMVVAFILGVLVAAPFF